NGREQDQEREGGGSKGARPDPPALPRAAHQPIDAHHEEGSNHGGDREREQLLSKPVHERLAGPAVSLFTEVFGVEAPRQREHEGEDEIAKSNDERPQVAATFG